MSRAVPADVVVQHAANPPPAVVPAVEPQPVEAAVERLQNEVRYVSYSHLVFWVCFVWCSKELIFFLVFTFEICLWWRNIPSFVCC